MALTLEMHIEFKLVSSPTSHPVVSFVFWRLLLALVALACTWFVCLVRLYILWAHGLWDGIAATYEHTAISGKPSHEYAFSSSSFFILFHKLLD